MLHQYLGDRATLKRLCQFGFLVCCLIASPAAADDDFERSTLKAMRGVAVIVEDIALDAARDGLTETILKTDAELKLRQTGIHVLSDKEYPGAPGSPYLYVSVATLRDGGLYAYTIRVDLVQSVRLEKNSSVATSAPTWNAKSLVGLVGTQNLRQVRRQVADMVDQFVNAYLAANQK